MGAAHRCLLNGKREDGAMSILPANLSVDDRFRGGEPGCSGDSHRRLVLRVYVSDQDLNALLPQPRHHRSCRFPREPLMLLRGADHPRNVRDKSPVLLPDGCLNCPDGPPTVATACDPVEPVFGSAR